jgi:hypothetical protein
MLLKDVYAEGNCCGHQSIRRVLTNRVQGLVLAAIMGSRRWAWGGLHVVWQVQGIIEKGSLCAVLGFWLVGRRVVGCWWC